MLHCGYDVRNSEKQEAEQYVLSIHGSTRLEVLPIAKHRHTSVSSGGACSLGCLQQRVAAFAIIINE
jgi:hypothetical protein